MNYFELFGIPVSPNVDQAVISKKYVALQKQFHPDFFTQENETTQEDALEKSAAVNKAIKIFRTPDLTLQYLLELKGLIEEEEKYQLPRDFLMEVMELNEDLSGDSGALIEKFEQSIYSEVGDIIEKYDDATITQQELLRLKEYYYKKKYLRRILERLEG